MEKDSRSSTTVFPSVFWSTARNVPGDTHLFPVVRDADRERPGTVRERRTYTQSTC